MSPVLEKDVIRAIRRVKDPDSGKDLISLGRVKNLSLGDATVSFKVVVDPARPLSEHVLKEIKGAIEELAGVDRVAISLEERSGTSSGPAKRPAPQQPIPGVRHVLAVASGKGGVGKSTVAVNLALAIAAEGRRTGLLDADIYGPSMPTMLGLQGARPEVTSEKRIRPLRRHGIAVMSLGFLVEEDTPMVWRGPMVHSAVTQFIRETEWGELDWLVVDLPPGTGDAHLTLTQAVALDGAVIVTTPQDIALIDAKKGLRMFDKVGTPVLGIVENMGTFVCPDCGAEHAVFGEGGGRATAERYSVPFLGTIPLHPSVTPSGDRGEPIVASDPDSPIAGRFREIARRILERVE
ncbi:MAG TPA: iron-sulfur cluster carrier protein ApbC [Gemmatimonadota bacterium]|nr:iron-sulfur cluster carrier protein ApbC [Gemmatimonadota bacterium]